MSEFIVEIEGKELHWKSPDMQMLNAALRQITEYRHFTGHLLELFAYRERRHMVDVGACTGSISWMLHKAFPEMTIDAYEPAAESFECLVHNLGNNPKVHTFNVGLSDKVGPMEIAMPTLQQKEYMNNYDGDNMGIMSVYGQSDIHRQKIRVFPLDLLYKKRDVDLIKIDAEGHDYNILLGAKELIKRCKPALMLEMQPHNFSLSGVDVVDFLKLLAGYGYKPRSTILGSIVFLPVNEMTEKYRKAHITFEEDGGGYIVRWREG